jgi:hypothetical protein
MYQKVVETRDQDRGFRDGANGSHASLQESIPPAP